MKQGCNLSKFKRTDVGGIQAEQKRLYKDTDKYKNDVNPELSHLNVVKNYISDESWTKIVREHAEAHQDKTGKKLRKDAVVMGSFVETVPASWSKELCEKYFDLQHDVKIGLLEKYGLDQNCLLSSVRHYDETNPHCTDTFMPMMEGKFNFKKLCSRQFYTELGQVTWQAYKQFEATHELPEVLEEPEWGSGQKHRTEMEYKKEQLQEELMATEISLNKAEAELQFTEQIKSEVEQELKGAQSELQEASEKLETLQSDISSLKDQETAQKAKNEILEAKGEKLSEMNEEVLNTLKTVRPEFEKMQKEFPELKKQIKEVKEELPDLKKQLEETKSELDEARSDLAAVNEVLKPKMQQAAEQFGSMDEAIQRVRLQKKQQEQEEHKNLLVKFAEFVIDQFPAIKELWLRFLQEHTQSKQKSKQHIKHNDGPVL